MAIARRRGDAYELSQPEPVGALGSLLSRLAARAHGAPVLLGVDFPIDGTRGEDSRWVRRRKR